MVEVNEENVDVQSEVELELDPSIDVDEAFRKISRQLSTVKEDQSSAPDNFQEPSEVDEGTDSKDEI